MNFLDGITQLCFDLNDFQTESVLFSTLMIEQKFHSDTDSDLDNDPRHNRVYRQTLRC